MAGRKKSMGVHAALMMIVVTLLAATVCMAADIVPVDKAQVNKWFDETVSSYKSTLDAELVKAEAEPPKVIKVLKDGTGNFKTIEEAIKSIPEGNAKRVIIYIGGGEYNEKVTVPTNKPFVTLFGDPKNIPTITFGGTAAQYGTVDSATLMVLSDYFTAANLVIKNSAPRPDGKRVGAQAVALRVSGTKAALYNCRMIGFQDTICDDRGFHLFKDCYVEGTVDFIFGSGKSLYLNTQIHVLGDTGMTVIAAQARDSDKEDTGYSFVHCSITGVGQGAYLGRAWRASPQVVYSYTSMSNVINPEGWTDSNRPEYDKTVFYGEYKCMGPGSNINKRVKYVKELTDESVKPFISLGYIQGSRWLLPPPNPKV